MLIDKAKRVGDYHTFLKSPAHESNAEDVYFLMLFMAQAKTK